MDCPVEVQLERLQARDGETAESAAKILAAQASREARLAVANDVIVNAGSPEELAAQVAALDLEYRKRAAASG